MRIIFLTLILALNMPTHSAGKKPPVSPWSIENAQNIAKSTWAFIRDNVKKALPQKKKPPHTSTSPADKTPSSTAPKTPPENKEDAAQSDKPTPAAEASDSVKTSDSTKTTSDKTSNETPGTTAEKPEQPSIDSTPEEPVEPKVSNHKQASAKALTMIRNWQVTIAAWYKTRVRPNIENAGPWIKEKTRKLLNALKNARENLKKKQDEYRKKREEDRKKPNPARTKRIHRDSYGDFGYDGFNLHKGSKKDSFTPDTMAIDPEIYFEQRTNVQTEPPKVEEKKPEQTTFMARLGGVPSGRISRFTMAFTGLAEHDHNLKNLAINGGITLLAHTNPDLYKKAPSFATSTKLLPLDINHLLTIPPPAKRLLFLAHANLLQYLVSHCIAYKSVPEGLKKALWDDTNMRNLVGMAAGIHMLAKTGDTILKLPKKALAVVGIGLLVGIAKIILDQFIESRNLLLLVKRDLASKPLALGIREGALPIEMRGKSYIVFNSMISKIASTLAFGLNNFLSAVVGPEIRKRGDLAPILAIPAASGAALCLKALFSIHNTYLLESDLEYLSPEIRARVVQHATSHKILSTMMYATTLATFAQLGVQLPTIMRTINKKKPVPFNVEVLEQLKAKLPPAQQATIKIDPSKLEYDYCDYEDANIREMLVDLLLLNLQNATNAKYKDIKKTVEELLQGERGSQSRLLAWLKRGDRHRITARSPVFNTEIDPSTHDIPQTLMDLLAQDISDKLATP